MFIWAMSLFVASKTESFSDAASSMSRGEFLQVNHIHIHGIQISSGVQVGGEGGEG